MESIRKILTAQSTAIVLLLLAVALIYAGGSLLVSVRSPEEYEDKGVMTFEPYRVLPHAVKNTGNAYSRRTNPTKTVYMVYYRAPGKGYEWHHETATKSTGQKIVNEGVPVERRVLSIIEEGTYITVEPNQTAESYVAGLKRRSYITFGVAALILVVLAVGRLWGRQRKT